MAVACHPDPSFVQFASAGKDGAVKLWGPHNASFGGDDENIIEGGETTAVAMDVIIGDVAADNNHDHDSSGEQISVIESENNIRAAAVSSTIDTINTGSCDDSIT